MAEPSLVVVCRTTTKHDDGPGRTVHAAATMPNFLITEYFVNFEELGKEIARPPLLSRTATSPSRPTRAGHRP